ncbi:HK97 family phage prohead protease [bacterium]|nr:HK97 family phage prohead protease [bacterium]
MERKTFWIENKNEGLGELGDGLRGYASVKNVVDSYGDVICDGAYGDLGEFVRTGFVAVGHDHSGIPVGYVTEAKEDERGLLVGMKFHSTAEAQAAKTVADERLAAGKRVGLSIGYLPRIWDFEMRDGRRVRLLKEIELKEFSLVTLPAAVGAEAMGIEKSYRAGIADVLELEQAMSRAGIDKN